MPADRSVQLRRVTRGGRQCSEPGGKLVRYFVSCWLSGCLLGAFAANAAPQAAALRDGQHDFDWDIGRWQVHMQRLLRPLTGSNTWVEYHGTDVVRKVWDGRANLGEVELDGPSGHLEFLTLRLYNPESHQWSMNITSSASGVLSPPAVGRFEHGHGEFLDQEDYQGRSVLVRFEVSVLTPTSCRFEQAFSVDGGKTWELNLIVNETLVKDQERDAAAAAPRESFRGRRDRIAAARRS
jgi:hypothetical protein